MRIYKYLFIFTLSFFCGNSFAVLSTTYYFINNGELEMNNSGLYFDETGEGFHLSPYASCSSYIISEKVDNSSSDDGVFSPSVLDDGLAGYDCSNSIYDPSTDSFNNVHKITIPAAGHGRLLAMTDGYFKGDYTYQFPRDSVVQHADNPYDACKNSMDDNMLVGNDQTISFVFPHLLSDDYASASQTIGCVALVNNNYWGPGAYSNITHISAIIDQPPVFVGKNISLCSYGKLVDVEKSQFVNPLDIPDTFCYKHNENSDNYCEVGIQGVSINIPGSSTVLRYETGKQCSTPANSGSGSGGGEYSGGSGTFEDKNDVQGFCDSNPTALMCKKDVTTLFEDKNDITDYCITHPSSEICTQSQNDIADYCTDNPTKAICAESGDGGGETGGSISEFCIDNPMAVMCTTSGADLFTDANDVSDFCLLNPDAQMCLDFNPDEVLDGSGSLLEESADSFLTGIQATPVFTLFDKLLNMGSIFNGSGVCEDLAFSLYFGDVSTDIHCTIFSSVKSALSIVMILAWVYVGFIIIFRA